MTQQAGAEADVDRELSILEASIVAAADKLELARRVADLAPRVGEDIVRRVRLLTARGVVENRQGAHKQALATALEARNLAAAEICTTHRSRLSRLIATIHAWRGDGEAAMAELLRAVAEARIAGDDAEMALALADGARACLEIERYRTALLFVEAALASPRLAPIERARSAVDRLKALIAEGRHGDCLVAAEECAAIVSSASRRLMLVRLLMKARAEIGLGDSAAATSTLADARAFLPAERSAYEHTEWREVMLAVDLTGAVAEKTGLTEARERQFLDLIDAYRTDALYEREAGARLTLAGFRYRSGQTDSAIAEAASALAIAARQHEPRLIEKAQSAMLRFAAGNSPGADGGAGLVSDRYLVCEELGRGGYGIVRRAYDLNNGRERALKFIGLGGIRDPAERQRLLKDANAEIETASRLNHPALLHIHSHFVDGTTIVIVQDLVPGEPLESLRGSPLDPATAVELFLGIAHGLAALHGAGLVHRDLKPTNVLVDTCWRPTLIDFGLTVLAGAVEPVDEPLRGVRAYVAPELLAAGIRPAPHASQDIYAFGVMLSEFLPSEIKTQPSLFARMLGTGSGGRLADLIRQMRSKTPGQRPASMVAVAAALDEQRTALRDGGG